MIDSQDKNLPDRVRFRCNVLKWIDARFPLSKFWNDHWGKYYVPKNLNFWYVFGFLAVLILALQIITGIFLTTNYKPVAQLAFSSVEYIMREVNFGWLIRYIHSTGASAFFIVIYLHMMRGMLYGSYREPRELVWVLGFSIFLCLIAEAFFGYLLPWGQMSYWGAQVIINLFEAIPLIGSELSFWIRGDYVISDVTLNRFFALHVIAIPLVFLGLVIAHLVALHVVGSNNPDGIEFRENLNETGHPVDGIPAHPYYTLHNLLGASIFLTIFAAVVFFAPEMGGYFLEYSNFIPADTLHTPQHIAPVWYFTPFYSILRASTANFLIVAMCFIVLLVILIYLCSNLSKKTKLSIGIVGCLIFVGMLPQVLDAKFWGVMMFWFSVMIIGALPWLDRSPVKSIRYRPVWHKLIYAVFWLSFVMLGYFGAHPPSAIFNFATQVCVVFYFSFFLLMPWWSKMGRFKPPPLRLTYRSN